MNQQGQQRPPALTAPLRDRFAAFLIDHVIIIYLSIVWAYGLAYYLEGSFQPSPSFKGDSVWIFLGGIGIITFIYFLLSEGIAGITLGKSFCGLSLVRRGGGSPSVIAIFVRNLFRFVDYALLPLTAILMEATTGQLRIGDWLAGTRIIKQQLPPKALRIYDTTRLATATRRTIAFLFDLSFFAAFMAAYLLTINPNNSWSSIILINIAPIIACAYFILPEVTTGATPGKILTAILVVEDDGRPVNFAGSLLRTILRIIDNNPFGFLCIYLGPKKQRIGDMIGGTLVIRQRPGWKHLILLIVVLGVIAGLGYLAYNNPQSFLKSPSRVTLKLFGVL